VFIEGDVRSEVGATGRFNGELVIVRLESFDEVFRVLLCSVLDAEVVHHETEGDAAGEVFEQAWRVGTLNIAVRLKVRDKTKLAETTGLRETIHALADFEVDGDVVEKRFNVVVGYSGSGDFIALDADVLIMGGGKGSAEAKSLMSMVNHVLPSDIVDWSRSLTTSKLVVRADTSCGTSRRFQPAVPRTRNFMDPSSLNICLTTGL
jgi:hypothetical protein